MRQKKPHFSNFKKQDFLNTVQNLDDDKKNKNQLFLLKLDQNAEKCYFNEFIIKVNQNK